MTEFTHDLGTEQEPGAVDVAKNAPEAVTNAGTVIQTTPVEVANVDLPETRNTEAKNKPEEVQVDSPEAKNAEAKTQPEDTADTDLPEAREAVTDNNTVHTAGVAVVRITSVVLTNLTESNDTTLRGGEGQNNTARQENAVANNPNADANNPNVVANNPNADANNPKAVANATNVDLQLKDTTFVVNIAESGRDKTTSVQVAKIADVEKTYSVVDNATSNSTDGSANTTSQITMTAHEENVALGLLDNLNLTRQLFDNAVAESLDI
jgi:hypothetical protein